MQADDHPLHGRPVPYNRLHPRLYLAEGAATALQVFFGLSMVIMFFGDGSELTTRLPSAAWRRFLAGACFGSVGALITISPLGRVSGAHISPAVSFAFWLEGKLWVALGREVLATGALVLAIFITAAHASTRRLTPWTIPPLFAWLVCWEGPWSGASTNPARSLGPVMLTGHWHQFWIYVLGPLAGAALAIAVLRLEMLGQHRVQVARLFHFT